MFQKWSTFNLSLSQWENSSHINLHSFQPHTFSHTVHFLSLSSLAPHHSYWQSHYIGLAVATADFGWHQTFHQDQQWFWEGEAKLPISHHELAPLLMQKVSNRQNLRQKGSIGVQEHWVRRGEAQSHRTQHLLTAGHWVTFKGGDPSQLLGTQHWCIISKRTHKTSANPIFN